MRTNLTARLFLATLLAGCSLGATPAYAQDPPADPAADAQDKDKKEKDEDYTRGQGKISEFGEALATFWSVSSAFQASQSFDDNIFLTNNFRKSDTVTKLSGRITASYRGRHTRFEASYLPEYSIHQRYGPLNYATHNVMQTFHHEFSPRLELNWSSSLYQAPGKGNLPFKLINFGFFSYSMYSLEALNDGINILNGSNRVSVGYKWTPRLKMTVGVDGSATHFSIRGNPSVNPVTQDVLYSAGGTVGFEYSLNPSRSVGLALANTYFGSVAAPGAPTGNDHQHYQSARVTFSQKFSNKLRLTASLGPGVTEKPGTSRLGVTTFFDVSLSRQTPRSGYAIVFQRSAQVGLLQGSITGYSVGVRANRDFGRRWISNAGGNYMRSENNTGSSQLESVYANAQIAYRLSRRITPYINYGYTHQKSLVVSPNLRNLDRNEIAVGFVYNFGVIAGNGR